MSYSLNPFSTRLEEEAGLKTHNPFSLRGKFSRVFQVMVGVPGRLSWADSFFTEDDRAYGHGSGNSRSGLFDWMTLFVLVIASQVVSAVLILLARIVAGIQMILHAASTALTSASYNLWDLCDQRAVTPEENTSLLARMGTSVLMAVALVPLALGALFDVMAKGLEVVVQALFILEALGRSLLLELPRWIVGVAVAIAVTPFILAAQVIQGVRESHAPDKAADRRREYATAVTAKRERRTLSQEVQFSRSPLDHGKPAQRRVFRRGFEQQP